MLIEDMVRINSPTGAEGELVDFLIAWANQNGFQAKKDDVGNFIAEKKGVQTVSGGSAEGSATKPIMMVGHVDTVPGDIPVRIENNILYGRGSVDAKGPLACFLEASKEVNRHVIVIGAVEEEGDSKGAKHLLGKYDPEYIIIGEPSGWSNLNMGYKGRINLFYHLEQDLEHGSSINRSGTENGIDFVNHLMEYTDEFNQEKSLFNQLGVKITSFNTGDDGLHETVDISINIRIPLGYDLGELRQLATYNADGAEITYSDSEKPVKAGKGNKLVSSFMRTIRAHDGEVTFKLKAGTSDMNVLQEYGIPMVTYGPGDSSLDHTPNEHLDLGEYQKAVEVLRDTLNALQAPPASL